MSELSEERLAEIERRITEFADAWSDNRLVVAFAEDMRAALRAERERAAGLERAYGERCRLAHEAEDAAVQRAEKAEQQLAEAEEDRDKKRRSVARVSSMYEEELHRRQRAEQQLAEAQEALRRIAEWAESQGSKLRYVDGIAVIAREGLHPDKETP